MDKIKRFSKKVPRSGNPTLDTIITIINVASTIKDVYDYFTEDNKK